MDIFNVFMTNTPMVSFSLPILLSLSLFVTDMQKTQKHTDTDFSVTIRSVISALQTIKHWCVVIVTAAIWIIQAEWPKIKTLWLATNTDSLINNCFVCSEQLEQALLLGPISVQDYLFWEVIVVFFRTFLWKLVSISTMRCSKKAVNKTKALPDYSHCSLHCFWFTRTIWKSIGLPLCPCITVHQSVMFSPSQDLFHDEVMFFLDPLSSSHCLVPLKLVNISYICHSAFCKLTTSASTMCLDYPDTYMTNTNVCNSHKSCHVWCHQG